MVIYNCRTKLVAVTSFVITNNPRISIALKDWKRNGANYLTHQEHLNRYYKPNKRRDDERWGEIRQVHGLRRKKSILRSDSQIRRAKNRWIMQRIER